MVSQITSLTIVYSTVYSGADEKNMKALRHWPSPHKGPVTRKMLPFDDVIMVYAYDSHESWTFAVTVHTFQAKN